MPLSETCSFVLSETPQDTNVLSDLNDVLTGAQTGLGLFFQVYAATLQPFLDGVWGAAGRGCTPLGIFDHSQAAGHEEQQLLPPFFKRWINAQDLFAIGTSDQAHQLVHDKKLLANVPLTPDQEAHALSIDAASFGQDWHAALAAGYPVSWWGSWNFSWSASSQVNTCGIFISAKLSTWFRDQIKANFAWIKANEPDYQTVLAALERGDFALAGLERS